MTKTRRRLADEIAYHPPCPGYLIFDFVRAQLGEIVAVVHGVVAHLVPPVRQTPQHRDRLPAARDILAHHEKGAPYLQLLEELPDARQDP